MIWIAVILAAVAIMFITLGALSVWVAVLATALKAMLIVPIVLVLYWLWQRFSGRNS